MYPWLVIRSKKLLAKNNCSMNQLCSCNLFINGNFKTKRKLGKHNPPNHLMVEPRYHHGDGSKITLLLYICISMAVAVKNQV